VTWPGRFEIRRGRADIIIDGAHNAAGARVLAAALREFRPGGKYTFILGVLADKDFREVCRALLPLAGKVLTVKVASERALSPETLARVCRSLAGRGGAPVLNLKSLESALDHCYHSPRGWTCLTGSLMLVGEARKMIQDGSPGSKS
jgi:dihydrofolate synthase/folylpolyglutamate synthase